MVGLVPYAAGAVYLLPIVQRRSHRIDSILRYNLPPVLLQVCSGEAKFFPKLPPLNNAP